MNRRSFLRGSGAALLGVATLGLVTKQIVLRSPASSGWRGRPYVEYTTADEYKHGPNRFQGKIKLSNRPEPIQHLGYSLEDLHNQQRMVVEELGWRDGSKKYYMPPKTS